MNKVKVYERLVSGFVHLTISSVVVLVSAFCVLFVWYPGVLADASDVWRVFILVVIVDVCLGPLITVIIFDRQKKELKRDMATIVIIQIVALLYGMHSIFIARPAFVVFSASQFDVVYANELASESFQEVKPGSFDSLPIWGPRFVSAKMPESTELVGEILYSTIVNGLGIEKMPKYYTELDDPDVKNRLLSVLKVMDSNQKLTLGSGGNMEAIENISNIGYLPLFANGNELQVLFQRDSGELVGMRAYQ
jgi:hypothetical protein